MSAATHADKRDSSAERWDKRNCRPPSDKPLDIQLFADMWHPVDAREDEARKLCRGCVVRAECAAWAIPQPDLVGIFGGTTTAMRAKARTKRRAA